MIGDVLGQIVLMVVGLVGVLTLAYASLLGLKFWQSRLNRTDKAHPGLTPRFLRALPLGQRERVVLLEVGDEHLLLGVTAAQINLLASWKLHQDERATPTPEDG